ncbi:MAG: hypothetical protein FWE06_08790 [Oscillospiraceae bacterium]|nr:hypothetical protein [Oscillospiraceae bacterium]
MSENNHKDTITKINDDLKNILSDENLNTAMDFVTHLLEIGITPESTEHPFHYISSYRGKFFCLVVCWNDDNGDNLMFCCWPGELDVIESDKFPISENLKGFARGNVKKCFKCGGCEIEPTVRMVFGEEHDNVCCNVFHFWKPNSETLENAKSLMSLLKHVIDDAQCSE